MELNELFRRARLSAGLTQEQCGDALHITPSAYGKMENGLRAFRPEYAAKLCPLLGVRHMDAFRCMFGGLSGNKDRKDDDAMNLHEMMLKNAAGILYDHAELVCNVAGYEYPAGAGRGEMLAGLAALLLFRGDAKLISPGHRMSRAIDDARMAGSPVPDDVQDAMAECALATIDIWRGNKYMPLRDIVRNFALYGNTDGLNGVGTQDCMYVRLTGLLRRLVSDAGRMLLRHGCLLLSMLEAPGCGDEDPERAVAMLLTLAAFDSDTLYDSPDKRKRVFLRSSNLEWILRSDDGRCTEVRSFLELAAGSGDVFWTRDEQALSKVLYDFVMYAEQDEILKIVPFNAARTACTAFEAAYMSAASDDAADGRILIPAHDAEAENARLDAAMTAFRKARPGNDT